MCFSVKDSLVCAFLVKTPSNDLVAIIVFTIKKQALGLL
jgi:hypothetical protein